MHATDYGKHTDIVLEFRQVFFSYNGNPVLENISFHLHTGEFAALIGQNGSGKTTALKLSLGLEKPLAGKVFLFGEDPQRHRTKVGYVPQYATADDSFPISVREVV
ncbi:MAG: ATP-binding cassette domain-containing protein, partial [Spirochaetales bacterium]|nr:ATP-binding cassette domain-containing protein [Spirochaetales bacterium]